MRLFVVQLHTRGWSVGISYTPEDRILTSISRLSREQRSQLQYLKVKFYRFLDSVSLFKFQNQYVVREKDLVEAERFFRAEVYRQFSDLRNEIFSDIVNNWAEIEQRLKKYVETHNLDPSKLQRLRPNGFRAEDFLDIYYTITPLDTQVSGVLDLAEEFRKKSEEAEEYRLVAERLRIEGQRALNQLRQQYEEKISQMGKIIEKLKSALKESEVKLYKAKLAGLVDDAKDIADLVGGETVEDLKNRLEAIKEFLTTG
jgi:hypothetical protein